MDKIMRLVEMEKNNTKDDGLFYQAAEIYQLVYNEKTIKDACNSVRCVINNVLDDNYNPEE